MVKYYERGYKNTVIVPDATHRVPMVLQYPLFCVAKVPVLHGKRAYIATQNRLFWKTKAMLLFCVVIFTAV